VEESILYHLGDPADIQDFIAEKRRRGPGTEILSPVFLARVINTFYGDPFFQTKATTGFVALLWALHVCSSVDTYGFGGGLGGSSNKPRSVYFERAAGNDVLDRDHDWDYEQELHNRLEAAGAVRRHFCAGKEQYRDSTVSIDPSSYDNKVAQAKLAAASSAASGTGGDGKEL